MAKAGRKRKSGVKREPNGRSARAGSADVMRSLAMSQPHRRGLGDAALDQRAESVIGRLRLAGRISEAECDAGEKLRRVRHAFMAELAGPRPVASASGQMVAPSLRSEDADVAPMTLEADREARREAVLRQWDRAERALWRALDYQRCAFATVLDVACDNHPVPTDAHLVWLRLGLKALAEHWRLEDPAEGAERGTPGLRPMRSSGCLKVAWGRDEREVPVIYRERA